MVEPTIGWREKLAYQIDYLISLKPSFKLLGLAIFTAFIVLLGGGLYWALVSGADAMQGLWLAWNFVADTGAAGGAHGRSGSDPQRRLTAIPAGSQSMSGPAVVTPPARRLYRGRCCRATGDDSTATVTDLSHLNHKPAGADGFVRTRAGKFYTDSDRLKIWGVNTCFGANFPDRADAEAAAAHMAKLGINGLRMHHHDTASAPRGIWTLERQPRWSWEQERMIPL